VTGCFVGHADLLFLTGAARARLLPFCSVHVGSRAATSSYLLLTVRAALASGLTSTSFVPYSLDYANPSGVSMNPVPMRPQFAAAAEREDILLIDDKPLRTFTPVRTCRRLKALDPGRRSIYLGSFGQRSGSCAQVGYGGRLISG